MDRWRCKTPYLLLSLHVSRVQIRQQRVCNVIVRGVPHVLDDFGHPQRKMLQVSEEQRTVRQSGIQVVAARSTAQGQPGTRRPCGKRALRPGLDPGTVDPAE